MSNLDEEARPPLTFRTKRAVAFALSAAVFKSSGRAEGRIGTGRNRGEGGSVSVRDCIDAEDGNAYGGTNADADQDLCGCRHLIVGTDGLDLSRIELLAVELTNAIDEDCNGFIEALVAGVLAAGCFDIGGRGPEQYIGFGIENAQNELGVVNDGSVYPSSVNRRGDGVNLEDEICLRWGVDDAITIPLLQRGEDLAVAAVCTAGERVEVIGAATIGDENAVGGGDLGRDRCRDGSAGLLGPSQRHGGEKQGKSEAK